MAPEVDAVILTKNEAADIPRAIDSLRWCNAIHVVDSGSTDETLAIAGAAGALTYVHTQPGEFLITEQRNWALSNIDSTADWVIFLDADEVATPEFADCVRRAISVAEPTCDAFYAAPAFFFHGKWIRRISGYPNWHPRLVRRALSNPFTGGVWEGFSADLNAGKLAVPYRHYPNSKGAADWYGKHLRYAAHEAGLITGGAAAGVSRKRLQRAIRYRLGPLRRFAYLFYLLFVRGGLLDGPKGWSYARRMYQYEFIIDTMASEIRHRRRGGEL